MEPKRKGGARRRVAISLEMDWGFKHHLEIYAGCQKYADEAGWDCSVNPAIHRLLEPGPHQIRYDGILARVTPALADAARTAGVPVVNVWLNSPVENLPGVYADHEAAGAMAAEHLLGRGFRQFGYLGFERDIDSRLKLLGFRNVVQREDFPCSQFRFSRTSIGGEARGWERFVTGLRRWVDTWKPPIGIFVCTDLICRYLIDVCRSKGLHVSQDVAIVGCGNEPEVCAAPSPALTSIDLACGQIGFRAAAMLDQLMDGGEIPDRPELVSPAELIPRQSTDFYAADDPLVARAMRFISENVHGRMRVNDVATFVAATRRTLERRFQESLGRSIAVEITRLRLECAKRRMVETDASMKDIAKDAGFRNADHLYKAFTRVEGVPPTRYRETHQKTFPIRED